MYSPIISLVIPCFNESDRLPLLFSALEDFEAKWQNSCEYIFVDDGSTDTTLRQLESHTFCKSTARKIKILTQANTGKGGALKLGVAHATGEYVLTIDADMAAQPTDIILWLEKKKGFSKKEILIGSRELKNSHVEDFGHRKLIGNIFNRIIRIATGLRINDTQCGFKLYEVNTAKLLFGSLQTLGWAHDVEILKRANLLGYAIVEMPVHWKAVKGSKINVLKDSWKMFWEVIRIRTLKG